MESTENPQSSKEVFRTPEEELEYLRSQVKEKESLISEFREKEGRNIETAEKKRERETAASEAIHEYQNKSPEDTISESHRMSDHERSKMTFDLEPEEHDTTMEELLWIVENRGIMNALSVVEEMKNPHIEDDFHRMLVQYIGTPEAAQKRRKDGPVFKALQMTLYEVLIPENTRNEEVAGGMQTLLSNMEQFYSGMLAVQKNTAGFFGPEKEHFTLEIAVPEDSENIIFYASIPNDSTQIFEKQVTSLFPDAQINETKEDYNIFNHDGVSAGSYAQSSKSPLFPIRTYNTFDHDPLNIILNALTNISEENEGVAIQFLVAPAKSQAFYEPYKKALTEIQNGKKKVNEALKIPKSQLGHTFKTIRESFKTQENERQETVDQQAVENINNKIETPIFETNIRIVTSAPHKPRAESMLSEIESSFHQFDDPQSSGLKFKQIPEKKLPDFLYHYTFRLLSGAHSLPLNTKELTSLFHFPGNTTSSHHLKKAYARSAPAPLNIGGEGVILGENVYRGKTEEIHFNREDRMRHFYTIGQTGTGKTTLLKNMVVQDIENGDGVCMIDPHGNDIDDILANIPRERIDDVIYFDPSNTEEPMGLNMLEYDPAFPEQKTFVVNEMLSIFKKIFSSSPEGLGPMFEQYFRNAAMLVVEDPESGSTLFDISRVLSDEEFRKHKLSKCNNPVVKQFWEEVAGKAGGEASLQNIVPYITSKFDVFLANDIMRPIVAQQQSAFDFRKIMDEKKILLVNLSKGRLGDINSNLLGLIIVGKILMAALSRVDSLSSGKPSDFFLYIDEFQNVTTDSISTILSEARKYRLSLTIAHQYIAQLEQGIRDSVFGNVGSMATFRVGSEDAEFLESQFEPVFSATDIMRVENRNALVKMLVDGQPAKAFNIKTVAPKEGREDIVQKMKELSRIKYGRPRQEIEEDIKRRYNK